MTTKIEWCARPGTIPETWNPITGCTEVSPGCKNCYARRMARRLAGRYGYPEAPHHFDVTLRPDRLDIPLKWRKPRTVFVGSMSDLFHDDVRAEFIHRVFEIMAQATTHTFILLTKRPKRMSWFIDTYSQWRYWPLPNVWGMVTVENDAYLWRIGDLLKTPFAVRGVSIEPCLSAIDLARWLRGKEMCWVCGGTGNGIDDTDCPACFGTAYTDVPPLLDWVIVGGETGPGARPMRPDWAREIRDQCRDAGVPFFFKKMSGRKPIPDDLMIREFPEV